MTSLSRSWVRGAATPCSCRRALRYFSAACWQWKHTRSLSGGARAARVCAPSRSSSALRTHVAVWRFIKYLALTDDFAHEPVLFPQPTLDMLGCHDNQVEGERPLEGQIDPHRLADLVPGRHDDEQVHVALGVGRAVGVGAEQDDLVRAEALGDLPREAPDRRQRDVRRRVAVRLHVRGRGSGFLRHGPILPTAARPLKGPATTTPFAHEPRAGAPALTASGGSGTRPPRTRSAWPGCRHSGRRPPRRSAR